MHFIATHSFFALVTLVIAIVVPPLSVSAFAYSRRRERQTQEKQPEETEAFREMLEKAGLS